VFLALPSPDIPRLSLPVESHLIRFEVLLLHIGVQFGLQDDFGFSLRLGLLLLRWRGVDYVLPETVLLVRLVSERFGPVFLHS